MPFKNILVALDGSEYSQIASNYAIWMAGELGAELSGQHVVDPRVSDLFIAPEFAEELGFDESYDTADKVYRAMRRIGNVILELFSKQAFTRGVTADTFLDSGYVVEEILRRAKNHDLLVMGHRGKGYKKTSPAEMVIGSVAERVAVHAKCPVLLAVRPVDTLDQILVAYDGSEPARGALLAAEQLALKLNKKLKAMTVAISDRDMPNARLTVEQGEGYLREYRPQDVFMTGVGNPAQVLIDYAGTSNSLLVLGSYGYKDPNYTVMGSTTTYVVRRSPASLLIYR